MPVPYTFATATTAIPLSQLDSNFATAITLGNTSIQLGNTVTTLNNMTLANVTVSSVATAITAAQGGTGLTSVGTSGNVLVSNGTTWTSQAPTAGTQIVSGNSSVAVAAANGNVTVTTNGTEAMRIDTSQNVGIGTSSPARKLTVYDSIAAFIALQVSATGTGTTDGLQLIQDNVAGYVWEYDNLPLQFGTNNTERARIDTSGRFLAGYTASVSTNALLQGFCSNSTVSTPAIAWASSSGYLSGALLVADNQGWSAAACAMVVGKVVSSGRSISAAGTLNASGADYAEYMVKSGDFTIAKGDVCGIDASGKLTNVFADAVSFVVKSTNPSYVGGDVWGSEDAIGVKKPDAPADSATDEEKSAYATAFAEWETKFNAERAKVDRIAFSGQVPVNVMGATPGQYIVPVDDNGGIKGVAKSEADLTLAEYMKAVGKVIAVEADGRAKIIVKVA